MTTYNTRVAKVADGSTTRWTFSFAGGYILPEHIKVSIAGGEATTAVLESEGTVVIEPALADGTEFEIFRQTPVDNLLVDWANGADISENNLDASTRQAVFAAAEAEDLVDKGLEEVVRSDVGRTLSDVVEGDVVIVDESGNLKGTPLADAEEFYVKTELLYSEALSLTNAVEVSTFEEGIAATSTGESFVIFSIDQIKRYRNGTSVDENDPVFVFPEDDPAPVLPYFVSDPYISGSATVDETLTGNDGVIANGTIMSRFWARDGVPIDGAYGETYVVQADDLGKEISLLVFAANEFGSIIGTSNTVGPIGPSIKLSPSGLWDGSAGSGFTSTPTDPTRTTAKPALHLITLPNQYFEDDLLVGAVAYANNGGTLIDGVEFVDFHLEGNSVRVSEPEFQTFSDANGVLRSYYGYWARLKKPDGVQGEAQLYVEAKPADSTMQNRVIGPFNFFPHDVFSTGTLHDYELEIAASQPTIAGQRYPTLGAALGYLRNESLSVDVQNPRIRYTEGGDVVMDATFWNVRMKGWCNVVADVPVTFVKAAGGFNSDASFRPRFGDIRYVGSNITFDTAEAVQYYTEAGHRLAFDGVNITNSRGRAALYRLGPAATSKWAREAPYYLECSFTDIHNACNDVTLARGGSMNGCTNDLFTDAACVIGTSTDVLDVNPFADDVNSLSLQYTGSAATATISLTGFSDQTVRTFTAKEDGVSVGAFNVQSSLAAYNANTNYTVQNVVDWINSLADWSATLIDNTRRATGLSTLGNRGAAFTDVDAKTSALTLATHFDLHSDWYAINVGGQGENVIFANNVATGVAGQDIFLAASSPRPKDFIFVNNSCANVTSDATGDLNPLNLFSQLGGSGSQSHVVLAHNSIANQGLYLRTDQGVDLDSYCFVSNNNFRSITWNGAVDNDLTIANNIVDSGKSAPGDTVAAGDYTTKFVDALSGNFLPTGELATNLAPPSTLFDSKETEFAASDARGAVALASSNNP